MPEYLHYMSLIYLQLIIGHSSLYPANPAYLDPGTGSLIIQMVIGALAGGLVGAKVFWKRIVGFFKSLPGRSTPRDQP